MKRLLLGALCAAVLLSGCSGIDLSWFTSKSA